MVYNIPITIERMDEDTELWTHFLDVHCSLNKQGANEYLQAGAIQSKNTLVFNVRYNPKIEEIYMNTQLFRIVYKGHNYNITDYDDFMFKHQSVKFLGESY